MLNVVCIKWGTAYGPVYVNRLYGMAKRNLKRPFRFVCFTDERAGIRPEVECFDIPPIHVPKFDFQPWRKLTLFAPKLADLSGTALFLDLDVLITGPLEDLFDLPGAFVIIENWTQLGQGIGNSSVFRFEIGAHPEIYESFLTDPEGAMASCDNEQSYISIKLGRERMRFWPKEWVVSFKYHCLPFYPLRLIQAPKIPKGAHVIAFHGRPKMDDAIIGHWPGGAHKLLKPSPWIADIWRE